LASEVARGRTITIRWDLPETLKALEWRLGTDGPWAVETAPSGSVSRQITLPGAREIALLARGIDSVGQVGPLVTTAVAVDVRLPKVRWADRAAPVMIDDGSWKPPIVVDWGFEKVSQRIEYRIDGGAWTEYREYWPILVPHLNGRTATFEFRAIEEDVFISEQALSAAIPIKFDLERWITERIDEALRSWPTRKGPGDTLRALSLVPADTLEVLGSHPRRNEPELVQLAQMMHQALRKPREQERP
jgi:hypothetical protein